MKTYESLVHIDLLSIIEKDCGPGHRNGRWWMFHCPFPFHDRGDKNPSLAVTPDNGRWHCFTCNRSGNAIGWLIQFRGLTTREAKSELGINQYTSQKTSNSSNFRASLQSTTKWQERGYELVAECERDLWAQTGQQALEYLHKRGLKDATIQRYHLGLLQTERYEPPENWGFAEQDKEVRLPRGITIPWITRKGLWAIKIRRAIGDPKYLQIRGGKHALFGAENLIGSSIGLFCEGEFDCMIADQEIGDAVGVATLGGVSQGINLVEWGPYLMQLKIIFAVYDADQAGIQGANRMAALGNKIRQIQLPPGNWKDINDFFLVGGDLWVWLKPHILSLDPSLEITDLLDATKLLGGLELKSE